MNSDSSRTVILSIASSRSSWVMTAMSWSPCRLDRARAGRMSKWGGRRFASPAGRGLLVADLGERRTEIADVRDEQARERCHRRLHPAGELAEQDLARRESREISDAVGVDRSIAKDATRDRDDLVG